MKAEILKLLRECDGHLSGQQICEKLQVSRTAVWKVIKQLQDEGYRIEAVRNKGYRLIESADVMTKAELESSMHSKVMGQNVVYYSEADSTNTRAKRLAEEGCPHGTLVVADCQTAGKGRRGRAWSSPAGSGIWMSLVLRPDIPPSSASMVTLVAALAVAEGIRRTTGLTPQIKWPNDIVLSGKKICGILTEMATELQEIQYVVIGIGINVNTDEFPEELSETATSLYLESGQRIKRSPLICASMEAFEAYYEEYRKTGDLSLLKGSYEGLLANLNREVLVLAAAGNYSGICRGINNLGELLVELPDGTVKQVLSGEVSVRGIYGYV